MKLRRLGMTGLEVSELCLGAMNFGMADWGVNEADSLSVIGAYFETGGNFIDTADAYSGGISEEICGKAVTDRRDRVVIATKGFFPIVRSFADAPAHANAYGATRRHLTHALEGSLKRLGTDYIDLYQVHCWDAKTPIHETLSALDGFVKSGKVRYTGLSNYTAWQIVEARQLCIRFNWEPFVTAQMQYSLVCRDIETGVVPACQRYGIGLLPWSPLGGGVLTGKYAKTAAPAKDARYGSASQPNDAWRARFVNDRNLAIAEEVQRLAAAHQTTATAVAIAWLLQRPGVSSVIIGPKRIAQLHDNLAACDLHLSADDLKRLDDASSPTLAYPEWFIASMPRNKVEG
jgi:aryl-alcohol dehydrogenase-like predicted oxidoreductase